jgi:hypothetical protein
MGVSDAFGLEDFDRYVEENEISEEDDPAAVAGLPPEWERQSGEETLAAAPTRLTLARSKAGAPARLSPPTESPRRILPRVGAAF